MLSHSLHNVQFSAFGSFTFLIELACPSQCTLQLHNFIRKDVVLTAASVNTIREGLGMRLINGAVYFCFMLKQLLYCPCVHLNMQYTVREAAKSAGIWEAAPTLEEITPQQMEKFNSVVSSGTMQQDLVLVAGLL